MKCGAEGIVVMIVMLNKWMWGNEYTPKKSREGVLINLFGNNGQG